MYKVAVVIPCYNAEEWITKTLSTALSQEFDDYRVFLVNDGSTDSTMEKVAAFGDQVEVLEHPGGLNRGLAATLNRGVVGSESKYIAFLDADDLWEPDKLRLQFELLEKNPSYGLVYCNGVAIDEEDRVLYDLFSLDHKEERALGKILLDCYIRTPSTVMIRRDVFEELGLFDERLQCNDHDMWIRCSEKYPFAYLPEKLARYRRRKNQLSTNRRQWEDGRIVLEKARGRQCYDARLLRKRAAVINFRLGNYDLKHGRVVSGLNLLLRALLMDPIRSLSVINSASRAYVRKIYVS